MKTLFSTFLGFFLIFIGIVSSFLAIKAVTTSDASKVQLVSSKAIWEEAEHNAFTDLALYKGEFFCVFRESNSHAAGENGKIRVLKSEDGNEWKSVALLAKKGLDLRDPKLSVTPEGKLMLNVGGSIYQGENLKGFDPQVSFSNNGQTWTPFQSLNIPGEWPWRVTWNRDVGYTASYHPTDFSDTDQPWVLTLMKTRNGKDYKTITRLDVPDYPGEVTLRFLNESTMVALARRQGNGWIGTSPPPYTDWTWTEIDQWLGGPNFLILPDNSMWATSREYVETEEGLATYVSLARMTTTSYEPVLRLPSGGDTSYAGMVYKDGILYISYYSSHEGKSKIYLAKVAGII